MTSIQSELGSNQPFEVAGQIKLFKAGLMGPAATLWSKHKDGEKAQLMAKDDIPLVFRADGDKIEDQIMFAGGYIVGWHEQLGAKLEDLNIWLEPWDGDNL